MQPNGSRLSCGRTPAGAPAPAQPTQSAGAQAELYSNLRAPASSNRLLGGVRSLAPPLAHFSDTRFHETLYQCSRRQLREWKPDCPFRGLVSLERRCMSAFDRVCYRIEAAVILETRIPYQRSSLELEGGDPIAEALDRARGRRANGRAEQSEDASGNGRHGLDVRTHLCSGPSCLGNRC